MRMAVERWIWSFDLIWFDHSIVVLLDLADCDGVYFDRTGGRGWWLSDLIPDVDGVGAPHWNWSKKNGGSSQYKEPLEKKKCFCVS